MKIDASGGIKYVTLFRFRDYVLMLVILVIGTAGFQLLDGVSIIRSVTIALIYGVVFSLMNSLLWLVMQWAKSDGEEGSEGGSE